MNIDFKNNNFISCVETGNDGLLIKTGQFDTAVRASLDLKF